MIKEGWLALILAGFKTWELRTTDTKIRGRISLIEAGSGTVVGEADLVDSFLAPTDFHGRLESASKHSLMSREYYMMDKWKWAWVLGNVKEYESLFLMIILKVL